MVVDYFKNKNPHISNQNSAKLQNNITYTK